MKIIYTIFALTISLFAIEQTEKISNIEILSQDKKEATINIGNLLIGQSGIVINTDIKNKIVILDYATVSASDKNSSKIKFLNQEIIEQNAIPKTKLLPKIGDSFIINHLYKNAIIIAPNYKSQQEIKKLYPNFTFINSDIFGGYLKINNTPVPSKEDITSFAHQNDLGIIFLVENNNINIIDAISFNVLEKSTLNIDDNTTMKPFYTNVEDIKNSTFTFFKPENIGDYNTYYKTLLGATNGK